MLMFLYQNDWSRKPCILHYTTLLAVLMCEQSRSRKAWWVNTYITIFRMSSALIQLYALTFLDRDLPFWTSLLSRRDAERPRLSLVEKCLYFGEKQLYASYDKIQPPVIELQRSVVLRIWNAIVRVLLLRAISNVVDSSTKHASRL